MSAQTEITELRERIAELEQREGDLVAALVGTPLYFVSAQSVLRLLGDDYELASVPHPPLAEHRVIMKVSAWRHSAEQTKGGDADAKRVPATQRDASSDATPALSATGPDDPWQGRDEDGTT